MRQAKKTNRQHRNDAGGMRNISMRLLVFAPMRKEGNRLINDLIDNFTAVKNLEIYRTVDSLAARLRQPQKKTIIAVIFAVTREDLSDIISIKELLLDTRIILILPDHDHATIAKGHMLRPRYVAYADTTKGEVVAVIEKMCNTILTKNTRKKTLHEGRQ